MSYSDDFFLKNYKLYDQRRLDGYAGAGILIKNNIDFSAIKFPDFDVINAVGATTINLPLNISFVSVYVPAKKKSLSESSVRQDLLKSLNVVKSLDHCIIGGDFNAFHHTWGSNYNDVRGILLVDELERFCMERWNTYTSR